MDSGISFHGRMIQVKRNIMEFYFNNRTGGSAHHPSALPGGYFCTFLTLYNIEDIIIMIPFENSTSKDVNRRTLSASPKTRIGTI